MRRFGLTLLLLVTACGSTTPVASHSSPSAQATPASPSAAASPSPSAKPTGPILFAALEAKGTNAWNTIVIAGLDGYAKAKASFQPIPAPYVGCAGAAPPVSAHVAAGAVYFVDGGGTIWRLSPSGGSTVVTRVPFTGHQQMISFAVSPDGTQLLAAVFTLAPKPASADPCSGAAPFAPGDFTLDVYAAAAGGASRLLSHDVLPTSSSQPAPNVMAFVGWDRLGPVATFPTQWASQGGGPHPSGTLARADAGTGRIVRSVSDPNSCLVWDVAASGDFVCTSSAGDLSVRRADGGEIWNVKAPSDGPYWDLHLSPSEGKVLAGAGSGTSVLTSGGNQVTLDMYPRGWLDETTVIGGGFGQTFTYVKLNAPTKVIDIGFTGMFIGSLAF